MGGRERVRSRPWLKFRACGEPATGPAKTDLESIGRVQRNPALPNPDGKQLVEDGGMGEWRWRFMEGRG